MHYSWRGLYLLGALAAGMLVADTLAPLSMQWHNIITIGIVFLMVGLTFWWTEGHADLMETDGVDAKAVDDQLQRRWFIAQGERFALPRPTPQPKPADGAARHTDEHEYAILNRTLPRRV